MSMRKLSLKGFLQEMEAVSSGTHPRKFCFVLGAGASINSGIPSGRELVQCWEKELRERNPEEHEQWKQSQGITEKNMFEHYSAYYERRFERCPTDGLNYMEKIMESAQPSAGYVMLSHMLTKTSHNVVVTTNFDHLTEDAVNYYAHQTPLVVGHEVLAKYIVEDPKRPTIIKIHRDLLFDPKSRTEDLKELAENWKTGLEKIFSNYHPVFIGYAGNDESLMKFLKDNAEKFKDGSWKFPYWTVYKGCLPEGKVKEFLEASEGYAISQEGFDEVMIQMGAQFGYTVPTEEEFLEEPKKRYKALKEAINGEIQHMFQEANELIAQRKFSEAEELLGKLVKKEPNDARYRERLCDVLIKEDKDEQALYEAQKWVKCDPKSVQGHVLLARIFEKMGSWGEALRACQKVIEINPDSQWVYYKMGNIQEKLGNDQETLKTYLKVIELDPDETSRYLKMGAILEKYGQHNEALKAYQNLIECDPNNASTYYRMGEIQEELGNDQEALKNYQKAIEIQPEWDSPKDKIKEVQRRLNEKKS